MRIAAKESVSGSELRLLLRAEGKKSQKEEEVLS